MTLAPPPIRVAVNDRQLPVVAVFEKGRVLVPFRAVVEALGGRVSAFHLPLPPPSRIIAGRYYAPIRYLANTIHAQIQYDARSHLVQVFLPHAAAVASGPNIPSVTFTSQPLASSPPQMPGVVNQTYQAPLQLNVYTSEVYGGDSVNVQLIAPPGGQAFAFSCASNYQYQLWAAPTSQSYSGNIPTRRVDERIQCPITAMYVAWNGAVTYAPYPAYVELLPRDDNRNHPRPQATQSPAPTPTPTRIPLPPIRRATPEPTATPKPAPTPTPPQRIHVFPIVHPTPAPTAKPVRKPMVRPSPKETPRP